MANICHVIIPLSSFFAVIGDPLVSDLSNLSVNLSLFGVRSGISRQRLCLGFLIVL